MIVDSLESNLDLRISGASLQGRSQKFFSGGLPTEGLGKYEYTPRNRKHDFPDAQIAFIVRVPIFFFFLVHFY